MTGVPFGTIDDAVAWAQRHGGRWSATLVESLTAEEEPAIDWPDDLADDDTSDEQKRRAALLAGAVLRRRVGGSGYPEATLLADIAYGAAFGTPQGQRCLHGNPPDPIKAHSYACILAERHGHSIDEAQELSLFTWLLGRLAIEPRPELIARMRSRRLRRHERLAGR